jgi:RecA-family ATPase
MISANEISDQPRFSGLPTDIPALEELKRIPQWVAWKYEHRGGPKPTKPPINPHNGRYASCDNSATWGTYEQAERRAREDGLAGVGFVLSEDDNLTGFDFDKCYMRAGKLKPWASDILSHGESYAEVSPSGRGVRLIARGKIATAVKCDAAGVEVYGHGRYLTITGQRLDGMPDTIGPAPNTKAASRARAKLHADTWAAIKRAGPKLFRNTRTETAAPKNKVLEFPRTAAGDSFWRNVNTAAVQTPSAWVPALFGADAKPSAAGGYRVTSKALGRQLQEDLSFHPDGIVDFGIEKGCTPIDVVIKHGGAPDAPRAATWLCERMGIDPTSLGWKGGEKQSENKETSPLPFINIADWDTQPIPERLWAVEGRIPLLQAYLFTGNGAVGKSLVELMRSVAHVLGRPWLGMSVTQGPAIYLGAEDEEDELHRRLADILCHYEATFAEAARKGLHLLSYAGQDCLLGIPDKGGIIRPSSLWTSLEQAAMDIKPVSISIDTVADVYGGNEIDRGQVTGFVKMLQGGAMRARCSVSILAHPSVAGMSSGSGLSGSTAWHNKVRARAYMRAPESQKGEEIDSDLREIEFKKNNYGPQGDTIQVRWKNGVFVECAPTGLEKVAQDHQDDQDFLALLVRSAAQGRKVTNTLNANNYAPTVLAREAVEGRKLTRCRLEQAMFRLFEANKIHVEEYGPPSKRHSCLRAGTKGETA